MTVFWQLDPDSCDRALSNLERLPTLRASGKSVPPIARFAGGI
jgi:hypothetical protein